MSYVFPVAECGQVVDCIIYTPQVCNKLLELVSQHVEEHGGLDLEADPADALKLDSARVCGKVTGLGLVDGVLVAELEPLPGKEPDFFRCIDAKQCILRPKMVFQYDPIGEKRRPKPDTVHLTAFHMWVRDDDNM